MRQKVELWLFIVSWGRCFASLDGAAVICKSRFFWGWVLEAAWDDLKMGWFYPILQNLCADHAEWLHQIWRYHHTWWSIWPHQKFSVNTGSKRDLIPPFNFLGLNELHATVDGIWHLIISMIWRTKSLLWVCFDWNWNFNTHLYFIFNFDDITACQFWWRTWWNNQWLFVKNYHVMSFRSTVFIFDRSKLSCIWLCFDFTITIFSCSKGASLQMREKERPQMWRWS